MSPGCRDVLMGHIPYEIVRPDIRREALTYIDEAAREILLAAKDARRPMLEKMPALLHEIIRERMADILGNAAERAAIIEVETGKPCLAEDVLRPRP